MTERSLAKAETVLGMYWMSKSNSLNGGLTRNPTVSDHVREQQDIWVVRARPITMNQTHRSKFSLDALLLCRGGIQ